jgi:hypothetical protein
MGKVPEGPHERLTWLEQWAAEQRELIGDRAPRGARMRLKVGTMLDRLVWRLDPVLDRGQSTAAAGSPGPPPGTSSRARCAR